jgi:hypothetical protein
MLAELPTFAAQGFRAAWLAEPTAHHTHCINGRLTCSPTTARYDELRCCCYQPATPAQNRPAHRSSRSPPGACAAWRALATGRARIGMVSKRIATRQALEASPFFGVSAPPTHTHRPQRHVAIACRLAPLLSFFLFFF